MNQEQQLLKIVIHTIEINEVVMEQQTIRMLLFDGYCESKYFHGKILHGGVDTQVIFKDKTGTLSARYMLKGIDAEDMPCSIYIENFAIIGEEWTNPKIFTDSKYLKWMEKVSLKGKILEEDGEIVIYIFEL